MNELCLEHPGVVNHYVTHTLINTSPLSQTIRIYGSFPDHANGLVALYTYPFNAADPETNCLEANRGYTNPFHPEIRSHLLQPNEMLVLVGSSHDASLSGIPTFEVFTRDRCGDGVVGAEEACDDGNEVGSDGCSADCRTQEDGLSCAIPGQACTPDVCGDGFVGGGEGCDDGDVLNGDGCSSACTLEPGFACPTPGLPCRPIVCGDGHIDTPESCDDMGASVGSGCSASCEIEFFNTGGAETSLPFGATVPVGRWATAPFTPIPIVYTFAATAGTTYTIDVFMGSPYACDPKPGQFPTTPYMILYQPIVQPVESDQSNGVGDCPSLVFTAPITQNYSVWLLPKDGPPLEHPVFIWIRETP